MINLLPWRVQTRRKQRQTFIGLLLAATVIATLLLGFGHIWLSNVIQAIQKNDQQLQTQKLQLENALVNYQAQQRTYLPVIEGILLLQRFKLEQINLLAILQMLAHYILAPVYLTQLTQINQQLVLEGVAHKHQEITELIQNFEATPWVKQAKLLQMQQQTLASEVRFKITLTLREA